MFEYSSMRFVTVSGSAEMSGYGSWGFICIIVAMASLGGMYITSQTHILDSGISVYSTAKGTHHHSGVVSRDGNMADLWEHGKHRGT